jgi:predicted phage gp36 major capsid-like protein
MVNVILDTAHQQAALDSPRKRFSEALKTSRQLQSDSRRLGHNRVDQYYEDVEGNWLESWQEDKEDK